MISHVNYSASTRQYQTYDIRVALKFAALFNSTVRITEDESGLLTITI